LGSVRRFVTYPFTAVVGLDDAKKALLAVAVNPTIGGVLLRGDKGTGKTTLVRALANVLPEIEVVKGCPFNCDPRDPTAMCDNCYARWARGERLEAVRVSMRVVDLPLSVTPDMLVGTIDIEAALREGVRRLRPGLLARANRNILYIDEVNLLDDYVADLILDAAAYGWNVIEREHISFKHPARFILVGSMNPEEGELRPQLLDRFGLVVNVTAPQDPDLRAEIVVRVEEFHRDPIAFYRRWEASERGLRERIVKARELLPRVRIDPELLKALAKMLVELKVRTCRAEITVVKTAKALAALDGRVRVSEEDLREAAKLALPHRLKLLPPTHAPPPGSPSGRREGGGDLSRLREALEKHLKHQQTSGGGGGRGSGSGGEVKARMSSAPVELGGFGEAAGGPHGAGIYGRSRYSYRTVVNFPDGIPVGYVTGLAGGAGGLRDVDIVGTAVNMGLARVRGLDGVPAHVLRDLIAVRLRRRRVPELIEVVLDASGSMNASMRISVAKRVAFEIARASYTRRSWLALITFRGGGARVEVPPTRKYSEVVRALSSLRSGGRTPLPAGLATAVRVARMFRSSRRGGDVKLVLISDGKANKPLWRDVVSDLAALSNVIRRERMGLTIYDMRGGGIEPAPSYLDMIASLSGGKVVKPGRPQP